MTARLGRITARLAEPITTIPPDLVARINQAIGPPTPVRPADVHIRAMFIVSDQVNSFGGCFPEDEHQRLAELLVDSPVLVGHRKDKLPVARTFHAVTLEQDGEHWVKAYFYWLRSAAGAEDLRENIDGGIYKECSIGFTFALAECSICGRDIRLCEHEPFQTYSSHGAEQTCHFRYRRIERVLESSLVYRGATPDTRITRELAIKPETDSSIVTSVPTVLTDLAELDVAAHYLIMPRYDYLPCTVTRAEQSVRLTDQSGDTLTVPPVLEQLNTLPLAGKIEAALVGYRGKERCPVTETERFLDGRPSKVRRLVLFLIPPDPDTCLRWPVEQASAVKVIPHRFVTRETLLRCAREITTREGIEIRRLPGVSCRSSYLAHPDTLAAASGDRFRLTLQPERHRAILSLTTSTVTLSFAIHQFSRYRLDHGTRFLADPVPPQAGDAPPTGLTGTIVAMEHAQEALRIHLDGPLSGACLLRPILLHGRTRFLFYRGSLEKEALDVA